MWYNLNFRSWIGQNLPTFLRSNVQLLWLWVQIKPIDKLYKNWVIFRNQNRQTLGHNGQVFSLRKILNDLHDPQERRIKILEGNQYQRPYIYTEGEQKPQFLGTIYLRQDSDYSDTGVDFIVQIPSVVRLDMPRLNADINRFRLASKRYKITYE